jgi:hypothetical protein
MDVRLRALARWVPLSPVVRKSVETALTLVSRCSRTDSRGRSQKAPLLRCKANAPQSGGLPAEDAVSLRDSQMCSLHAQTSLRVGGDWWPVAIRPAFLLMGSASSPSTTSRETSAARHSLVLTAN